MKHEQPGSSIYLKTATAPSETGGSPKADQRWFLSRIQKRILVVTACSIVGAMAGVLLARGPFLHYRSSGVLSMELSAEEYKRVVELANSTDTVRQLLEKTEPRDLDINQAKRLIGEINHRWQEAVPRLSREDVKTLPETLLKSLQQGENQSIYLGVRIFGVAPSPQEAMRDAGWLGTYIKDVAIWSAVKEKVATWTETNRQFSDRAKENKLKYEFSINQAQARAAALKKMVDSHPNYGIQMPSQLVDVRRDNERFVAPAAQLVGAESEAIDLQEKIRQLDRTVEQEAFSKELLKKAVAAIATAHSGTDSLKKLSDVILSFDAKAQTDAQRERLAMFSADLASISARFATRAQYISPPALPLKPEGPPAWVIGLVGAHALGLMAIGWLWREQILAHLRDSAYETDSAIVPLALKTEPASTATRIHCRNRSRYKQEQRTGKSNVTI